MDESIQIKNRTVNYKVIKSPDSGEKSQSKISIFMVHGWGGSSDSLTNLATLLSDAFDSYIIDLPGFGTSDMPDTDWGTLEYAELVSMWIDEIKSKYRVNQSVYFGHSFGGGIGVYLAGQKKQNFDLLMLSGSAVYRNPRIHPIVRILKKLPFYSNIKSSPRKFKRIINRLLGVNSDSHKFEALEPNYRKIITFDLSSYAKAITLPTLILWGNDDEQTPISQAYRLAEDIDDEILKIYPNIGHGLPKLKPELMVEDINKFITSRI